MKSLLLFHDIMESHSLALGTVFDIDVGKARTKQHGFTGKLKELLESLTLERDLLLQEECELKAMQPWLWI